MAGERLTLSTCMLIESGTKSWPVWSMRWDLNVPFLSGSHSVWTRRWT